jgi:hypothetical protein
MLGAKFKIIKCPDPPMMPNAMLNAYFSVRFGNWESLGGLHGNERAAAEYDD